MKIVEVEQNTPEWEAARSGHFTASGMHQIISPIGKKSSQVDKYINTLIGELITKQSGNPFEGNNHSQRGHEFEQEAADYYSMLTGLELQTVGFCLTDNELIGCSPDRFVVGQKAAVEIKTCLPHIMVEMYQKETLEQDHRPQTQTCLYVTGFEWIDTVLYCPKMKPVIMRSTPNRQFIMDMLTYTNEANKILQERVSEIKKKGYM